MDVLHLVHHQLMNFHAVSTIGYLYNVHNSAVDVIAQGFV